MANLEEQFETHEYDVIVIGAGGAGLRAAIASAQAGLTTAVICKSLLGKAHTVMAEGGVAASLGNVDPEDGWKTHFSDTMKGGKGINNWRMAEIFAKEARDRVLELERWGAVFDRTPTGLINQRPFGAHSYRRLCHIGDRTGLELIRTLQDKGIHSGIDVFMEYTMTRLLKDAEGGSPAPSATGARTAASWSSRPRRWSWPPAAGARSSRSPPTPGSPPATASPWPSRPAPS